MAIGDKYKCNKCHYEYTAVITREAERCKNALCDSTDITNISPKSLPEHTEDVSIFDGIEKTPTKDTSDIDAALHRLEFKEVETEEETRKLNKREERKMAKEDKPEGWSGTATGDYDPQMEFKSILKDMGLKNKIESITKMFYAGDIDSPIHMDECLKTAGIDVARRRLAIASYYGHIPDELKKDDGDSSDDDAKEAKKAKGKDVDPLKEFYNEQKRKKAEKLMEITADMEIEELEAKLEKKAERLNNKNEKSVNDVIRIPATDAQGNIIKDEKGVPVIMEIPKSDMPFYLMTRGDNKPKSEGDSLFKELFIQQNKQIADLQSLIIAKAQEGNKPDERAIQEKKYWEERAERERVDRDKLMAELNKQRQESIAEVYKMREEFMKRDMIELTDTLKAVNKPIEVQLHELKTKGELAQSFGLIPTGADPKTAVQTEIARGFGEEGKALVKEVREGVRQGVQEGLTMVKEERQKARGVTPAPPPDIGVNQADKDAVYAKLFAKMEEDKKNLEGERQRIAEAKADLDKKSAELIEKWEKANPQQLPPTPSQEQPKSPSIDETVKGLGVTLPPEKPVVPPVVQEPPKPLHIEVHSEPDTKVEPKPVAEVEDPIEKKLKELEGKGL
jgi:hypothetical protein